MKTFLLLTDDFPPSTGGGIATWAAELAVALHEKGLRVIVFTRRTKIHATTSRPHFPFVVKYLRGADWNRYRSLYMAASALPLLARGHGLIVLASTWQHAGLLRHLKKLFRFTLVCFAHAQDITKYIDAGKKEEVQRNLGASDVLVPVSRYLQAYIQDRLSAHPNAAVIHNGIDASLYRPLPEKRAYRGKFGLPRQAPLLLSVGRTIEMKGFYQLISAMPEIRKQVPDAVCVIAGKQKQPEYARLLARISELQLNEHVLLMTPVPYTQLPELYNACDVFVLAARPVFSPHRQQDNFPLVTLEASACGLPVIGTDCGGVSEAIIDGKTGYVVPFDDLDLLAAKATTLLQNPALRQQFGAAGREFVVANFTRERVVEKLLAALATNAKD